MEMRSVYSKKGISSQQFHWLFVLVAGGIILLFFITIIMAGKQSSENKLAISMMNSFDAIFAGSKASDNTLTILDAPPNTAIEFVCDRDGYSELAIGSTTASKHNSNKIIFAKKTTEGRQYVLFTRSINVPFKVDNALYITDLHTKYFVLDDPRYPSYADAIMKILPANVTKEKINDVSAIAPGGFREVVIITFSGLGQLSLSRDFQKIKVTGLSITPTTANRGAVSSSLKPPGQSRFRPSAGTQYYYGSAMLLGAIFSEDGDYYECAVKKLYKKLAVATQLYVARSQLLSESIQTGVCQAVYLDAVNAFDDLKEITEGRGSLTPDDINSQQILQIEEYATILKNLNEQVELHSCPLLY
jgi:hypothetical protein